MQYFYYYYKLHLHPVCFHPAQLFIVDLQEFRCSNLDAGLGLEASSLLLSINNTIVIIAHPIPYKIYLCLLNEFALVQIEALKQTL